MNYKRKHLSQSKRERILDELGGACYYCGYYATTVDHVIPHSWNANDSESNLIPACNICNSIASNKHFENLQAKKEYILSERSSLKWKRKLSGMTKTIIRPSMAMPKEEPERLSPNIKPAHKKRQPKVRVTPIRKPRKPFVSRGKPKKEKPKIKNERPKAIPPLKTIYIDPGLCMLSDEEKAARRKEREEFYKWGTRFFPK